MLKNINEKLSELPQEGTRVIAEGVTKLNGAIGDLINTDIMSSTTSGAASGNWTPSVILRRLFSTASRAVSFSLVGIVGFVIFRSYVSQNGSRINSSSAAHLQMLNDIQDPQLAKTKKSREEIEEVRHLKLTLRNYFFI